MRPRPDRMYLHQIKYWSSYLEARPLPLPYNPSPADTKQRTLPLLKHRSCHNSSYETLQSRPEITLDVLYLLFQSYLMLRCLLISKYTFFIINFSPLHKRHGRPYFPSFTGVGVMSSRLYIGSNEFWGISINETPLSDTGNNAVLFSQNWPRFQSTVNKSDSAEKCNSGESPSRHGVTFPQGGRAQRTFGTWGPGSTLVSIQETISARRIRVHCTSRRFLTLHYHLFASCIVEVDTWRHR